MQLFKRFTGQTLHCYLTTMRVVEAHRLLVWTDDSVSRIAFSAGFNPLNRLFIACKNHCGETPKGYRWRHRQ